MEHPHLPRLAGLRVAQAAFAQGAVQARGFGGRPGRPAPRVGPQLPRSRKGGHALGCTLRPGAETPLWNDLVRQIRPHLRRRGSKAQLARLLGVPRQRLQMVVKTGSACLDAERILMLVGWLGFFQRGGRLAPVIQAGLPRATNRGAPRVGQPRATGNL